MTYLVGSPKLRISVTEILPDSEGVGRVGKAERNFRQINHEIQNETFGLKGKRSWNPHVFTTMIIE